MCKALFSVLPIFSLNLDDNPMKAGTIIIPS